MEDYRKIAIELGQTLISKAPETREDVERMLPELKESEGETVRKAIKKALQVRCDGSRIISDEPVTLEEAISWLEKQGEQKPAWSEEDEAGLSDAMWAIEQARTIAKDENDMGNLWYAEHWLKSLRPQNAWKPTEEQMDNK